LGTIHGRSARRFASPETGSAADDVEVTWTVEIPCEGFTFLQQTFAFVVAPDYKGPPI
jgi:hypothetical protein